MSAFIAGEPDQYFGKVVGDGHCVAFVRRIGGVPHTSLWRRGERVGPATSPGACIATFNAAGHYANATDGSSHAAILTGVAADRSIAVIDQWKGRPVGARMIRDKGGEGPAVDDASRYYVIAVAV